MPAVSQFSTADNLDRVNKAIAQLEQAMHEAELAVQAGLPNADATLSTIKDELQKVQRLKETYFPGGMVSGG